MAYLNAQDFTEQDKADLERQRIAEENKVKFSAQDAADLERQRKAEEIQSQSTSIPKTSAPAPSTVIPAPKQVTAVVVSPNATKTPSIPSSEIKVFGIPQKTLLWGFGGLLGLGIVLKFLKQTGLSKRR